MRQEIRNKISKIITEADLAGLIRIGAPNDEYKFEIDNFVNVVRPDSSLEFIHQALYNIFYNAFSGSYDALTGEIKEHSKSFIEKQIGTFEKYQEPAKKIYSYLRMICIFS